MRAIFLDIETSGLDCFRHQPLEIAFKIFELDTGEEKAAYQAILKYPQEEWDRRDLGSVLVNGFTQEKMLQGKEPVQVRDEIISIFRSQGIKRGKSVFICQNPAFDKGFFSKIIDPYTQESENWPYHWLDLASMFWALRVQELIRLGEPLPDELSLSKNAIATMHHLPPEETPHGAMNGVNHLLLCYRIVVGFGHLRSSATL